MAVNREIPMPRGQEPKLIHYRNGLGDEWWAIKDSAGNSLWSFIVGGVVQFAGWGIGRPGVDFVNVYATREEAMLGWEHMQLEPLRMRHDVVEEFLLG